MLTEHTPFRIIQDAVRIDWDTEGEGWGGDYDPTDPNDEELLRFTVFRFDDGEWQVVDDASYCTAFPVATSREEKMAGLAYLMGEFHGPVSAGERVRKLAQQLSNISQQWVSDPAHAMYISHSQLQQQLWGEEEALGRLLDPDGESGWEDAVFEAVHRVVLAGKVCTIHAGLYTWSAWVKGRGTVACEWGYQETIEAARKALEA
jgi:hypothetical protein